MMQHKTLLPVLVLFVLVSLPFVDSVVASSEMWSQTYGGPDSETAYALIETSDGGFALAGGALLVKTDEYGVMEWNQTYSGMSACSLVETLDGGFSLAGGALLMKTDAYGNMEWNRTYSGLSARSLVETMDGGYALAGYTNSSGAGSSDFWLVKTDAQGIPEFPSWIVLPLFLIVALVVAVYKKKLTNTTY